MHWEDLEGAGGEGGGRGHRDGNTCKPMAVSFQCMTKFTTNKKKRRKIEYLISKVSELTHEILSIAIIKY